MLAEKLAQIERKIIVGGENLLEKAEAQAKLLEDNEKQLEKQRERQAQLKKIIDEKEVNIFFIFAITILNNTNTFDTKNKKKGRKNSIGRKIRQLER